MLKYMYNKINGKNRYLLSKKFVVSALESVMGGRPPKLTFLNRVLCFMIRYLPPIEVEQR